MDALEAIGDVQLRAVLGWVRAQPGAVDADQLAAAHGIHRNVARSRLERLAEAGLLHASYERRTGRSGPGAGRPAKVYAVAPSLDSVEFPARRYELLLALLMESLPRHGRSGQLQSIGVDFGRQLAHAVGLRPVKTPKLAFERVCQAVRQLGYQASVEDVSSNAAVIATPTCPLRPLVSAHPEAAEIDRGMWRGLTNVALAGSEVTGVECETRDCLEEHASCRVLLRIEAGKPDDL
jgi:predicted ArsR family transcriptional regulator